MKLLFLNGSRGEWGYIKPIIDLCRKDGIAYDLCATNMTVLPGYGMLVNEQRQQRYNISDEIYMSLEGHNHYTMTKSLSVFLASFVDVLVREKPTWLILSGDRGEQLMAAIAAAYTYTPVAHIQAGELSGNIDGVSRHAIGKFAHLHFAANEDAAQRLKKLGEEEFRIHNVGHPALDAVCNNEITTAEDLSRKYRIDTDKPYILVVLHPVTEDVENVSDQTASMMNALKEFDCPKIWVLSNNDAGSAHMRENILNSRDADIHVFRNLPREDYLAFMKYARCMTGNSSSGLLEAPTFSLPAVNLGRRQHSRVRGSNVIDASFDETAIKKAIDKAMSDAFKKSIAGMSNPYGDGKSAQRILKILQDMPIDDKLLVKRLTY